jgi:ABC-type antimicrobial peptide transport system permease subunit
VGIALGIVLGIGISRNVIDSFAESTPGIEYVFPWTNILLIVAVTYSAALLITYLTARQAAKVNPADALRFE